MNTFFEAVLRLFKPKETYSTGALREAVDDYRTVSLGAVQKPVGVSQLKNIKGFEDTIKELNIWLNQQNIGACVPHAITKLKMLYRFANKQATPLLTPRWGYKNCKTADGFKGSGTYPRIGALSAVNDGFLEDKDLPNDTSLSEAKYLDFAITPEMKHNAYLNRFKGFAAVDPSIEAIKEAIYQNGAICGATPVKNWGVLPLQGDSKSPGHYTIWYRVEDEYKDDYKIYIDNSWGPKWLNWILNWIFPGRGYFLWSQYKDLVYDIYAFVDIPPEIMQKVKAMPYKFTKDLYRGKTDPEVKELQKFLNTTSFPVAYEGPGSAGHETNLFGMATEYSLIQWQKSVNLPSKGYFGQMSRDLINKRLYTNMIEKWAKAIQSFEGWKVGSRSYRNNNPGNIRYSGMFAKLAKASDPQSFCIFASYEIGFDALKTLLTRACTGLSTVYSPEDTLLQFYSKYAPSSDGNYPHQYAAFVAKQLGVTIDTKIGSFNS